MRLTLAELTARETWRPLAVPDECDHPRPAQLWPFGPDQVQKHCRKCGQPLEDPTPRCSAFVRAQLRRCLLKATEGQLCREHQIAGRRLLQASGLLAWNTEVGSCSTSGR